MVSQADKLLFELGAVARTAPLDEHAVVVLAGWTAELALKGFLLHRGLASADVDRIGHDLVALWCESNDRRLGMPKSAPEWLLRTHGVHARRLGERVPRADSVRPFPVAETVFGLQRLLARVASEVAR